MLGLRHRFRRFGRTHRRAVRSPRALVLVDGRNVQRSGWPNPSDAAVVAALDAWAATDAVEEEDVVAVFDGAVAAGATARVQVVAVPYADDELVVIAAARVAAGATVRAATSDRELRSRLEAAGAHVAWGGGRFLRELGLGRARRR